MRSTGADSAFRQFLSNRGQRVEQLDSESAVAAMIDFYMAERADDVVGDDGDMLLFQWGTYDWGAGPSFQYEITRQFISDWDDQPDDAIWQLALTVHFEPGSESESIGSGDRWCEDPSQVEEFRRFVEGNEATTYARTAVAIQIDLRLEQAG